MMYNYTNIMFSEEHNYFSHSLNCDYGCFVLWKSARPYKDMIRNILSSQFEILLETEIEWSSENFHDNASRFYEMPLYNSLPKESRLSAHADQIGDNIFILFVIKDNNPNYSYLITTSDIVEIGNLNMYNLKKKIRTHIFEDIGILYPIHSTNGIQEFFFQAPLLLGVDLFKHLLSGEKTSFERISKDLEGANGWSSWSQVFKILNITCNYVLLDFENVLNGNDSCEITLLTDDYQRIASTLGVNQLSKDGYKGVIIVEDKEILINIRFLGDNYFNTSWQKDMLASKVFTNDVFTLRNDMHFFTLLYYCKVHKNEIKATYIKTLNILAKQLNFVWYKESMLWDDKSISRILKGFFEGQKYHYEIPLDRTSFKNKLIIQNLPNRESILLRESNVTLLKKRIKRNIPDNMYLYLRKLALKAVFYFKINELTAHIFNSK